MQGFFDVFVGIDPLVISHFLAKFFGIYLIVAGLYLISKPNSARAALVQVGENPALQMIWGFTPLIGGLLVILGHPHWVPDWPVLVTIIGWALFIGGLLRLFVPETVFRVCNQWLEGSGAFIWGLIWLVLGLILAYFGFFHV